MTRIEKKRNAQRLMKIPEVDLTAEEALVGD